VAADPPPGRPPSLRSAALSGIGWTTAQTFGTRLITGCVFVVLARLLSPTSFGLVALAVVFVSLLEVFVEQGFAQAIIQRPDVRPGHLDSAFWACAVMGVVMTGACAALAGPIASVFGEPDLAPLLRVLGTSLLITGLSSIPQALLKRELRFRSLALRTTIGALAGGVAGVAAAIGGLEAWSLVIQILVQATVATTIIWLAVPWRPGLEVSWLHFHELFSFGINMIGINILTFLNRQSDDLLIAAFLGTRELGFYSVGYRILLLLTEVMTRTIDAVTLPTFSRVQHELDRLRSAYLMATRISSAVATPVYLALAALSPILIPTIFGAKWEPAVPVAQILAFIGVLQADLFFNDSVLIAVGKPQRALAVTAVYAVSNVIAFAVAVHWGITAVAAAYVIRGYILSPLPVILVRRILHFRWSTYLELVFVPVGCAAIMVAAILLVRLGIDGMVAEVVQLLILIPLGAAVYATSMRLLAGDYVRSAAQYIRPAAPSIARILLWRPGLRPRGAARG
jgi:O-antigen/teichoic acid export membrane protein